MSDTLSAKQVWQMHLDDDILDNTTRFSGPCHLFIYFDAYLNLYLCIRLTRIYLFRRLTGIIFP